MNGLLEFIFKPFTGRTYTISTTDTKERVVEKLQYVFAKTSLFSTLPYINGHMVGDSKFKIGLARWHNSQPLEPSFLTLKGNITKNDKDRTIITVRASPGPFMYVCLLLAFIAIPILAVVMQNATVLVIPFLTLPIVFAMGFYIRKFLVESVKEILIIKVKKK